MLHYVARLFACLRNAVKILTIGRRKRAKAMLSFMCLPSGFRQPFHTTPWSEILIYSG
jgi:hypothetical protein